MLSKRLCIPFLAVLILLWMPRPAHAWGPATHTKIACDILEQLPALASGLAALLAKHRKDFVFGNIAADVVFAKRLSKVKQYCHQWTTGFQLLESAPTDAERAFAYGYLSHLAADTVAHNKYLPRQMTVTGTTMSFGHLYWELRADSTIGTFYWEELRDMLSHRFNQHERVLSQRLTDTLLPFHWNLAIFYRLNTAISRKGWIRTMDAWYHRSRWELADDMLAEYRAECVDRALDVIVRGGDSVVLNDDPNGTIALSHTRLQRRQVRQMARAGILYPHVLNELVAGHAPIINGNGNNTPHDPPHE